VTALHKLRSNGPLLLHAAVGTAVITFSARIPCGEDECLALLYTGASAGAWTLTVPLVVLASAAGSRALRALAWVVPLLWPPVAWAAALALFLAYPSLGGA
jgi:hypothetical protein